LTSIKVNSVFVLQSKVIEKVIADLTEKIKNHPLDVKSLEYSSKLTAEVACIIYVSVWLLCLLCSHPNRLYYGSCPFFCLSVQSVHLYVYVLYMLLSRKQRCRI